MTVLLWQKAIRRIWNLSGISRTCNVHSVGSVVSIYTILFIVGLVICLLLPCPTLHLIFALFLLHDSSHVSNSNSIGYNCMYGTTRCLNLQITLPLVTYLQKSHCTHFHPPFQPQWTGSNCISCCMFTILYTPIFAPFSLYINNSNKWRWLLKTYVEDCSWTTSSGQSEMPSRMPTTLSVNCRYMK